MIFITMLTETADRPDSRHLEFLLERISLQETSALAELYELTSHSVYGYALSVLKNTHDAQDVLQSCFINIWNGADSYRPCGKPLAWIITVAKNLCLLKLREAKRQHSSLEDRENSFELSTVMTADEKMLVELCLSLLSDEERQILVLHAVSGFKHREIAAVLGMPLATTLSKYNRAIKKIRKKLSGGEESE